MPWRKSPLDGLTIEQLEVVTLLWWDRARWDKGEILKICLFGFVQMIIVFLRHLLM